jgi:tRNA pseudouridine13 synthase
MIIRVHPWLGTVRYLTEELPGIGGAIKEQPGDFVVEELPLYAPAGVGEHTFFEIGKTGLSTFEAIRLIARELGVPEQQIGYAGLKDSRAVTRQVLSVLGVPPERIARLDLPGVLVYWAKKHTNKLKVGHLQGNRFTIRIRSVDESSVPAAKAVLDMLTRRGAPNRFGPQRFGLRGDSAELGRAIVKNDPQRFIQAFLGGPHPGESEAVQAARTCFEAGQWVEALHRFPRRMADERRALEALVHSGGDHRRALGSLPKRLRLFLLSAYQSALFNAVMDARLSSLDRVFSGDLAMKHPGHSVFQVEDETVEQPRAARFEISPTGPLFGFKMMRASGSQGDLERGVLAGEGLELEDFRIGEGIRAKGGRRALRFQVHEPEMWFDEGVVMRFRLEPGCYATAVLAEIMKAPPGVDDSAEVMELTEL